MDPILQTIINIGAACTALAAVAGLVTAFVKAWPHIKRAVMVMSEVERLPEMAREMKEQSETLETIRHELFPNSGKSLRDAVDQQGKQLAEHMAACPPPAPTTTINVTGVAP